MDKKTEEVPKIKPERGDVIGFWAIRKDGLIETKTWCTFGDIADFVMEQIEKNKHSG